MNGLCLVAAAVIHFIVGHPEHVYPLRRDVAVTNAPPVVSVIASNAISIRLKDGEALWGLGERFDAWNQRWHVVECWAQDMAQGGPASSYFAVPFFISSEGRGLFVNCTGKVSFDSRGDKLRVEAPESGIDAYMFSGTPREILAEYTRLVGRPAMPPAWVFQPWLSRNSYLGASEIDLASVLQPIRRVLRTICVEHKKPVRLCFLIRARAGPNARCFPQHDANAALV